MTKLKFNILKTWIEMGKIITVNADDVLDVKDPRVEKDLLASGHAEIYSEDKDNEVTMPRRRGRPSKYENKDEGRIINKEMNQDG